MSIKSRTVKNGKIAILEVKGTLLGDEETDQLRLAVADFIEQGNKCLIVNLQKVNYLNSSGVGAIIAAHASYSKNGGEVCLTGVSDNVQNLLAITRLVDVFEVYESVDEAIESFAQIKSTQ